MKKISISEGFFLILLIALSFAFYKILTPFIVDILIAVIIAKYFYPVFNRLQHKFKFKKTVTAFITVLLAIIVIFIPLFIIMIIFSEEAASRLSKILNQWPEIEKTFMSLMETNQSKVALFIEKLNLEKNLTQIGSNVLQFTIQLIQGAFMGIGNLFFHLMIILTLFFFLLLDGNHLIKTIYTRLPLKDKNKKELIHEIILMINTTLTGTFIIGLIEGLYGLSLFLIFSIPSALVLSILVIILSILPLIGSFFVYIPVGIIMILIGNISQGLWIIVFGIIGASVIQNIIKPKILGDQSGLHPALVLLSTLGGIFSLGLIGFLVGPLIAALFVAIWNQFGYFFQEETN